MTFLLHKEAMCNVLFSVYYSYIYVIFSLSTKLLLPPEFFFITPFLSSHQKVFFLGLNCTSNLSLCAHILPEADVDGLCFKCVFEIAALAISADVSEVGYFSFITKHNASLNTQIPLQTCVL